MTRRVTGEVAPLDTPDEMGRVVQRAGFTVQDTPLPLLFLRKERMRAGFGHSGSEVAGRLTSVYVSEDGQVVVEGDTDVLAPGCYPCGMDVNILELDGDDFTVLLESQLIGVTAYDPDGIIKPSFHTAHIYVEEELL